MFSPPFVGVNGVNMTFLLPIHIYNIYLKSVLNTPKIGYSQWSKATNVDDTIINAWQSNNCYALSNITQLAAMAASTNINRNIAIASTLDNGQAKLSVYNVHNVDALHLTAAYCIMIGLPI